MPFHTAAFIQSIDPAGVFTAITAAADQVLTIVGTDIRVPTLRQLIAAAAGVETAVASQARLTSPSLRIRSLFRIEPFNGAAAAAVEPASPQVVTDLRGRPVELVAGENLNAELNSNPVAAQTQWVVVWFADRSPEPVSGAIFTVRATAATVLVGNAWTNAALTFVEDLPRGRYQIVGFRALSAGLVAARLVFVGEGAAGWRPGVLGTDLETDLEHPMFRYGQLGVFGEFEDTDPPTVDFLSVSADAAESVHLDLIQVRAGPG